MVEILGGVFYNQMDAKTKLECKYNTVIMKIMSYTSLEHKLAFPSIRSCQICFDRFRSRPSY